MTLAGLLLALVSQADGLDWPQWRGARRDGVWRETGLLERFPETGPRRRWSVPLGGGYTGPTVASGRVYVMDRPKGENRERVVCLDWKTGATQWVHAYDAVYEGFTYAVGPRASVTVHDGKAYALGAAGHLHCLDASTGQVVWKRDLRADYRIRMPLWGIAAHPLIEGDRLITQIGGAGEACVVALDRLTGEERWKAFPDDASYAPGIAVEQGGRRVVVMPLGFRLVAFDPADGKLLWSRDQPKSSWPIAIPAPAVAGDLLLFSSAHAGSVLLKLRADGPSVDVVWDRPRRGRSPDTLSPVIPDVLLMNGLALGVQTDGELRCLDLKTGKRLWETADPMPKAWHATMHLVRAGETGDRAWMFTEQGELILARLAADGYHELTRAKLLDPTVEGGPRGRAVTWAHPAFAYRHVFARSDREIVCVDLSAP
ncbi:MAG TPA: PQQ-binding-like beta-propeller repeat protein [Planctomycetota bacterium]|nr:PQQ-binding-like beta-propeller repeat protein [Planctomycetota bacterium]